MASAAVGFEGNPVGARLDKHRKQTYDPAAGMRIFETKYTLNEPSVLTLFSGQPPS
jgi:hypothetical protein